MSKQGHYGGQCLENHSFIHLFRCFELKSHSKVESNWILHNNAVLIYKNKGLELQTKLCETETRRRD